MYVLFVGQSKTLVRQKTTCALALERAEELRQGSPVNEVHVLKVFAASRHVHTNMDHVPHRKQSLGCLTKMESYSTPSLKKLLMSF